MLPFRAGIPRRHRAQMPVLLSASGWRRNSGDVMSPHTRMRCSVAEENMPHWLDGFTAYSI